MNIYVAVFPGKCEETWVDAHSCPDSVTSKGARGEAITGSYTVSKVVGGKGNKIRLLSFVKIETYVRETRNVR